MDKKELRPVWGANFIALGDVMSFLFGVCPMHVFQPHCLMMLRKPIYQIAKSQFRHLDILVFPDAMQNNCLSDMNDMLYCRHRGYMRHILGSTRQVFRHRTNGVHQNIQYIYHLHRIIQQVHLLIYIRCLRFCRCPLRVLFPSRDTIIFCILRHLFHQFLNVMTEYSQDRTM